MDFDGTVRSVEFAGKVHSMDFDGTVRSVL